MNVTPGATFVAPRVSIAIQHHPARAHLLPPLLEALLDPEVVTDPAPDQHPSPWRTYRHALELTPTNATHRLIIQDDTLVSARFHHVLTQAVVDHPSSLLALFVAGAPQHSARAVKEAHRQGALYAMLPWRTWTPTVALCWPRPILEEFLAWADNAGLKPGQRGDDSVVGRFVQQQRLTVVATVPSVVEHPDREPSLIGRRAGAGRNRNRVAAIFDP